MKTTSLALLLIACLALGGVTANSDSALLQRANRVLQEGVKANITRDPAVKRFCDDAGIPEASISINEDERKSQYEAKVSGRFGSLIANIDKSMQSNGAGADTVVKSGFGTGIGFGIIVAALAFLSFIFLFFWSITECCCKKVCCQQEQKKGEGRGWIRWACYIASAVFALATISLTIAWSVFLGRFSKRFPEFTCAVTIMKSDIIDGVQLNSTSVFIGATQADVLLANYVTLFDSIASIKTNSQNVKNRLLTTKANDVVSKSDSYSSSFSASSYTHPGVFTPATTVTVGFALLVKGSVDNGGLKAEARSLADVAKSIDNAVTTISGYDQASIASTRDMLNNARLSLGDKLKKPIIDLFNSFTSSSDGADAALKRASTGFIVTSVIVIIVLTLIYFLILWLNIKDKCYPLKTVSKLIMLLQLLLAVLILIMGAILTGVSIFFTYACVAINGAITTPDYLSTNFKGAGITPQLAKIINGCLYEKGDGNFLTALDIDLTQVNNIGNITDGMQSYINFKGNLTSQSAPYLGGMIAGNISAGISNDLELAGSPVAEDTMTGMTKFNSYTCSQDKVYLKTGPPTVSASGDAFNTQKGSTYSIIRIVNGYSTSKYAGRYTGSECATLPSSTTSAQANVHLTNLLTAQDNIPTVYGNLKTNFDTGFYTAESGLFTQMKASTTDLDAIYSKINGAIDYLNSAKSTLPLLLDCRVLRKEITIVSNILCFKLNEDFYQASGLGLALGFFLFLYSWCMCCSIRMTTKLEEDENKGAVYYDPNNQGAPAYQNGQNNQQYNDYK